MRPNVYQFVKEVAAAKWPSGLPVNTIVHEIGSFRVGNDPILRDLFPNVSYVGLDMRPGPNVDFVCDVEDYGPYPDGAGLDMILCCDTLEHVERPWKAVKRMQQALGPGGLLVVAVPFIFGVHSHPNDYWRFTTEGLKSLFDRAGLQWFAVGQDPDSPDLFPHTVVGVASNQLVPEAVREVVRDGSWRTNAGLRLVPVDKPTSLVGFDTQKEVDEFESEIGPWWEARQAAKKAALPSLSAAEQDKAGQTIGMGGAQNVRIQAEAGRKIVP